MKTILSVFAFFCCSFLFAGVNPSPTNEYCPLQELYFDVDYSGNQDFVTILEFGNLDARLVNKSYNSVTNVTIFRLAINFRDVRASHHIKIEYKPNAGGNSSTQTIPFPYVKS